MASLVIPVDFADGNALTAAQLDQNFNAIRDFVNQATVHQDGTTALDAPLACPFDPVTADDLTRKSYVDKWAKATWPRIHVGTYMGQNQAAMTTLKDTNADLGTPTFDYTMLVEVGLMIRPHGGEGHIAFDVAEGAAGGQILLEPNGAARHSVWCDEDDAWVSGGTLFARKNYAAGVAARWRFRHQNIGAFATYDVRMIAKTLLYPQAL